VITRKTEHMNNTDEQVWDYVTKALNLVDGLELGDVSPDAVFAQAVALYSGKQIAIEATTPGVPGLALPPNHR
jgi:hypothetical protein